MSGSADAADPVAECLAGRIGPGVACARLALAGLGADAIVARLRAASALDRRFAPLLDEANRARIRTVVRLLAEHGVAHDGDAAPEAVAAMFDRLAAASPEAAVALYSLGDPVRLAEATEEIVEWLDEEGLLASGRAVLDLGCGIGRVALAIAPRCRAVHGVDVSAVMVGQARRRAASAGIRNATFAVTSGRELGAGALEAFGPAPCLDLVLAVDSMPYVVASGHADRHVADAARLLRPGGALAILNLRYGPDGEDVALARGWAARHGLAPAALAETPFRHWDARCFILRRS